MSKMKRILAFLMALVLTVGDTCLTISGVTNAISCIGVWTEFDSTVVSAL